jgi:hypothetical protein
MTIRLSEDARRELTASAARKGKAVSAEAAERLEYSLRDEWLFSDTMALVFGSQGAAVLEVVGYLMKLEGDWLESAQSFANMRRRIELILDAVAPKPEVTPDSAVEPELIALLRRLFAGHPSAVWYRWHLRLRDLLGPGPVTRIIHWLAARAA